MGFPYWDTIGKDSDDVFNTLTLGADPYFTFQETKVTVKGDVSQKWDVKEAPGTDGARITNKGYTPAEPEVSWLLYTVEHRNEFDRMIDALKPKTGKTAPVPILVIHPQLVVLRLAKFVVKSIGIPEDKGSDIFEVSLKLIEWFPQPKPSVKAAAADALARKNRFYGIESGIAAVPISRTLPSKSGTNP